MFLVFSLQRLLLSKPTRISHGFLIRSRNIEKFTSSSDGSYVKTITEDQLAVKFSNDREFITYQSKVAFRDP